MASDYARNVVACKLSDLVGSPPESILGVAIFDQLASLYPGGQCWVHSEWEFQTFAASAEQEASQDTFALVPQRGVLGVGRVDFAIFVPHISRRKPLVVVEVDGHDYHERTSGQASSDNRRDRTLQELGIPVFRFTATDVLRNSADAAREIAEFVHKKLHANAAREAEHAAAWDDGYQYGFLLS
jgi:very-short-patch-repair endonuclease